VVSAKTLLRLADEAGRAKARHEALSAKHAEVAVAAGQQEIELRRLAAERALTDTQQHRSMLGSKMELQNARQSKRVKISRKMTSDSVAKKALLEANITPKDVATLLGVGHSTVNAWCTGARSIPREHVERLREKHRIAAKVWPKIGP